MDELNRLRTENADLRRERAWLIESIERLNARIARMQAERWTANAKTIADGPGCDDEVSWKAREGKP